MNVGRSKFNVGAKTKRTAQDGTIFDSEGELRFYEMLRRCVAPASLHRQVEFELIPAHVHPWGDKVRPARLTVDFLVSPHAYWEPGQLSDATVLLFDFKGMVLPEFLLRKKLFEWRYGVPLRLGKDTKRSRWECLKLIADRGWMLPGVDWTREAGLEKLPQAQWKGLLTERIAKT